MQITENLRRERSRLCSFVVTNPGSDILHYTILMLFVLAEIPLENCIEQLKLERKGEKDREIPEKWWKKLDSMSDVRKTKLYKIVKDATVVSIKPVAFQSFAFKKLLLEFFLSN